MLEEDNAIHIQAMLESAKCGNWDVVFDILESKPFIINCISYDKAWGVLHHAAFDNNFPIVKRLVKFKGCDPKIKTKQDLDNLSGPGKTPRQLTTNYGIKSFLIEAEKRASSSTDFPTFVMFSSELELTGASISLALSCFQQVLCNHLDFDNDLSFSFIMNTIFKECINDWSTIKKHIGLSLQMCNIAYSNYILYGAFKKPSNPPIDSVDLFFHRIIGLYTSDRNHIYGILNRALLQQGKDSYLPKGRDIAFSAYGIVLNAILMYWKSLNRCRWIVYRCMDIKPGDLAKYLVGKEFTWLNFSSCSKVKSIAKQFNNGEVTFKIHNGSSTRWSPRYIESHSFYPKEQECLYPFGARFVVTKVNGNNIELNLSNYYN